MYQNYCAKIEFLLSQNTAFDSNFNQISKYDYGTQGLNSDCVSVIPKLLTSEYKQCCKCVMTATTRTMWVQTNGSTLNKFSRSFETIFVKVYISQMCQYVWKLPSLVTSTHCFRLY